MRCLPAIPVVERLARVSGDCRAGVQAAIKLSLSPGIASRLVKHPSLTETTPVRERVINSFYDTPDLRLRREQLVVQHRKKGSTWRSTVSRVALADSGHAGDQRREVGAPGDPLFAPVDDGKLKQWLETLQPAFASRFTRSAWTLEPRAGVRIELALDRGWIVGESRRQAICELGLELISGSVGDLFAAAGELQNDPSLRCDVSRSCQRAYRALANESMQAVKAAPARTDSAMSAIAAFRAIAQACLGHLQSNEQSFCESDNPELLRQALVAIRRLRSAIRIWAPLLPEEFVSRFDSRWQVLVRQFAEARDGDVFLRKTLATIVARFPTGAESGRLSTYAGRRCASSRERARGALKSVEHARLLLEFTAAVLALPERDEDRLDDLARACIGKHARDLSELAAEARVGDAAARESLRCGYKGLRDALAFFAPLFPGELLRNYHLSASGLQAILRRLNELAVASQFTEEALPGQAGEFIRGWLEEQSAALLPELRAWLSDFEQHPVPWRNQAKFSS